MISYSLLIGLLIYALSEEYILIYVIFYANELAWYYNALSWYINYMKYVLLESLIH